MSNFELALISFPVMLGLIFLRVPIAAAMGLTGFVGTWIVLGRPDPVLNQLKPLTSDTFSSYSLSILPPFLLMVIGGGAESVEHLVGRGAGHRERNTPVREEDVE